MTISLWVEEGLNFTKAKEIAVVTIMSAYPNILLMSDTR